MHLKLSEPTPLSVVLWTDITDVERVALTPNDEYAEIAWRLPTEIVNDRSLHPILNQCAAALLALPA